MNLAGGVRLHALVPAVLPAGARAAHHRAGIAKDRQLAGHQTGGAADHLDAVVDPAVLR